ncbi:hypothetical protein QR685DRAFT_426175, partial [Neurospora intermedia]
VVEGDTDNWQSYEVEKIMDRKISWHGSKPLIEYWVKYKGYGTEHNEWHPRGGPYINGLMENAQDLVRDYERIHPIDAK